MLSKPFVTASVAFASILTAAAQTSTDCNPLEKDCPADAAVGKKGVSCDFTKGECDAFEAIAGKKVTYESAGAVCSMDGGHQAPTIRSKEYIFYGKVEVEMKAAPGPGVLTTLVFESDDLDEIDWEAIGSDQKQIQSNIFSKGDQTKHDLGDFHPVDGGISGDFHKYTVDWNTDRIEWSIDGTLQRTLKRADIGDRFPQSPMQIRLGAWVAGFKGNDPGTITWAGGLADFSNGPAKAYYKSVKITDYAGGSSATDKDVKEYSYGDRTGSSKSIQIKLKDGSTTSGDQGGSTTTTKGSSSESSTKSSTKTSSESSSETTTESSSTPTDTSSSTTDSTTSSESTMTTATKSSTDSASSTTASNTATTTTPASGAGKVAGSVIFGALAALFAF